MKTLKSNGIGYIAGSWPLDPGLATIIFIHGAAGTGLFWQPQIEGMLHRANTLAIDLPGHGKSDGSGLDSVEAYTRSVMDFIETVQAPKPIPCGLSLGGAITQQLLLDFPGHFAAGILINTGARLRVAPVIFETIEQDFSAYVKMVGQFAASEKTDAKVLEPFAEEMGLCKPEVAAGDFRACDKFDVTGRLSAIDVPVLVLTAGDDKLTPPKYGDFLGQNIKNSKRAHIMDAGHIAPLEKPDEVNGAIISFLDGAEL